MNTETDYLRSMAEELAAVRPTEKQRAPNKHLLIEAKRLEHAITVKLHEIDNFTRRETYYFDTLARLIQICDILFDITGEISPDVRVLINLLDSVRRVVPAEVSPRLQLPKAFIHLQQAPLASLWEEHLQSLRQQNIDPNLIAIAEIPFKRFINSRYKLFWRDFRWLKAYNESLENIDWENADCASADEALMSVLIGADLNDQRFFIYCKKYIKQRIGQYAIKKRRLAELYECEKLILQDSHNELPSFNHRRHTITFKLINWIKKEADAIKSIENFDDDLFKIEFNWDVDTLALFWKYLMEHGITKMVNVDMYAKQIAATCSSKGKVEFKWETIKGRFYGKDQRYLKKIYEPFTTIVEDIRRFLR